ncbi:MAG TPA: hypothetical protein VGM82_22380 [Gemmatimonadaceae bacterium]
MNSRALLASALLTGSAAFTRLSAQDPRLVERLDRTTLTAVTAVIDSARTAKLPTAPLVDKALEGAARGSDGGRIINAVHQLSARMATSRGVLGTSASADEIKTAASALDAGVGERDIARVHVACGKRPVTMALSVLTDLIGRNVPIPTATNVVLQLARSGAKDTDLSMFQRNVRADIDRGADPSAAATTRARGLVARSTPTPAKTPE